MTVTRDPDAGTLAKVRFHDPWPRPADWFDTLLPADFGWRGAVLSHRPSSSRPGQRAAVPSV